MSPLDTFAAIATLRAANRDESGRIEDDIFARRLDAFERALAIRTLGWQPERPGCAPGDRFAATTGELRRWAERQARGLPAID